MAFNFKNSNLAVRENRLGSITGFVGDLETLVYRSECGSLKNRERCFSQSSSCLSTCALSILAGIRNIAIIYHAPAGCAAFAASSEVMYRQIAAKVNKTTNTVFICSDLNENDTVFGAVSHLKEIVRKTYENYRPDAIFVSGSCASGVIGEDIDSLTGELQDEYTIPIVPIHCEGFKSRIWATGFDITDHAVLQGLVKPPKEKRNVINFKNFFEGGRKDVEDLFREFGIGVQMLYCNSTVEELSHLSESLATVCICSTLGTYLGNALEQNYGVPYIQTNAPVGIEGFEEWLRKIGNVIGISEKVEAYIARQRAIYIPQLEELKKQLRGYRAVIGMGPGFAYEVARVLKELGLNVEYILLWHYDQKYDDGKIPTELQKTDELIPDLKVSVADEQNYEVMNVLNRYKPDIYFSRHPGTAVWANKQGVAAYAVREEYTMFGYARMVNFAKNLVATLHNQSLEKNIASHCKSPYTKWWYEQQVDKFLVQEKGK
ncbi:MAG: nitrogenase [Treponema sp.]|nr:nitrogenase [Treponema sp.]